MSFMDTPELATKIRRSTATLKYWRAVGDGPKWFKVGRRVLYASDDVDAWLESLRDKTPAA